MDNALKAITETCGEGVLVKGQYFKNFDSERLTGIKTLLRLDAKANGDLIHGDSFQYVASVPIEGENLSDDYFLQRRNVLDEAVPQYGADAPPSFAFRSRQNNNDTRITDVELGQYGGRVGVYKQIDENGENTRYHLVAVGGAQLACEDLKNFIGERAEAIENWSTSNTFDNNKLRLTDEFGYARHVAEINVKRMLYRAASAFEVKIPTTPYVNVNLDLSKQSFPSMAIPSHLQTINTIGMELSSAINQNTLGIYREVVPPTQIAQENPVYILEGPADPIHVFEVSGSTLRQGIPATSGRRKQLPQNVGSIAIEHPAEYKKRTERVFFEGKNEHPDLDSGVFNKIQTRRDNREFVDSLIKLGWNEKNHHERLIPVCVKVSNPFLIRQQQQQQKSTTTTQQKKPLSMDNKDDFDE
jgi:hypothetical protein